MQASLGASAPACTPCHGLCPGRRPRQPPHGIDGQAGQACRVFRRQIAHHRFRALQRAQFRHPPHRRRDPVQRAQPDPPPAARLELLQARAQRELRHPAGEPAPVRHAMVCRHCGRRVPEHRHHPRQRAALHRRAGRRPRLQDGLREDAPAARRERRGRHRRLHRGAAHGGHRLRRHACRRAGPYRVVSGKARGSTRHAGPAGHGARQHGHLRVRHGVPGRAVDPRCRRPRILPRFRAATSFRTS